LSPQSCPVFTGTALLIAKDINSISSNPLIIGSTGSYTLTVKNTGNQTLTTIKVADDLPTGVKLVAGSASYTGTQTGLSVTQDVVPTYGNVSWTIASLAAGASISITYSVSLLDIPTGSGRNIAITYTGSSIP